MTITSRLGRRGSWSYGNPSTMAMVHLPRDPGRSTRDLLDDRVAAALGDQLVAYVTQESDAAALQSSLDVVLCRFAEYHGLEGAFARRAVTERAKGILMERHSVDEKRAFAMLREQARRTNRKITDIAEAVALSVPLLPKRPGEEDSPARP